MEINSEVNYDKESEAGVTTKKTWAEVAMILSYGIIDNVDIVLGIPRNRNRLDERKDIWYILI